MEPSSPAWRRLTRRQYERTLKSLVAELVSGADFDAVWSAVEGPLATLPSEQRFTLPEDLKGSYRRLDQAVDQGLVEAWYGVARAAADALTAGARLQQVYGPCATDGNPGNDAQCVDDLLDSWGARVLRRPLDADARQFYEGFFGPELGSVSSPEGFADVLAGLLNAPQMLYMVEHGEQPENGDMGMRSLDAYELATRLSYHFWGSPPDQELTDAAASGALLESREYERQVDRLFNHPDTRATLREFYRDWLKLEDTPDLDFNNNNARFVAFAGDDLPTGELRGQAIEEILDLLDYYTWEQDGSMADILTTDRSFAKGGELATLYGIEAWDGQAEPPSFGEGERPGFLTRLAFLATGSPETRPIMKGVFIRHSILCDDIPPPPDNAAASAPELSPLLSTRETVEGITEVPGTACAGCHQALINGIGFALEGFDALGRVRFTQPLYDEDGNEIGEASVNTVSTPKVVPGDLTETTGPEELATLITESGKAHACLTRNYFRFSFGRWEDSKRDGCALEEMRSALAENDSLREMLRSVALTQSFKQRSFTQESL